MLDFSLTPEQLELQKNVREFAIKEVFPASWHYDEKDEIPVFVLKKAFEAGIMSGDIPKKYGGHGFGLIESAIAVEEIAAACPGLSTSIFVSSLGIEPIILSDKEHIKEKYLTKFAKEFTPVCFATSEPVMGSDVAGIQCRAVQDGDDYILNGTKYWITNGGIADYMTVFATVDPKQSHAGICAFLVERGWKGVSSGEHIPKMGQRCSNTAGLNFKNVRVPKENVLAEPGKGFVLAMKTFSRTRPIIGAFATGAARSAMEYAIDYAKKRRAFGTKIANFEAIQFKIAEMYQKIETSRLLVYKSAWEADQGMDPTINASIAKFYSTESALEILNDALQIFGGYGYTKMFPIEKLLRDVRLLMIYEGTSEVQRMIVAGHAMGGYKPVMPALEDLPMIRGIDLDPAKTEKNKKAWRCRMCGHIHYGDEPPEECPYCFFPATAFKKVWPVE
ncbi:MAG: acyl-CoA dehydrogenase family protein [Spirochaetes bacterium]|jgi:acyl-CoA dehydrogenase|nr:acyl-CoA dehydrogenase family protein [Spirochaetota bacterium]